MPFVIKATLLIFLTVAMAACQPPEPKRKPSPQPIIKANPAITDLATANDPIVGSERPSGPTPPYPWQQNTSKIIETKEAIIKNTVIESHPATLINRSDLARKLPGPARTQAFADAKLNSLKEHARTSQTAAIWRQVAERAVALGDITSAHEAYRREASIYKSKGFTQAALAEGAKAEQYETVLEVYESAKHLPPKALERLEPASGCYIGAFIDRDPNLGTHLFQSQTHGDVDDFNRLTGKSHACFFMYRSYGQAFPTQWAEYVKSKGAIVHIAWEPRSLKQVYNEVYLKEFFDAAARLDHPVILRFASEMNGDWTGYSGDPAAYIKAFRYVYQASRRAPKVAMLWCPNTVPQDKIKAYYPGDAYVDWVGVNFYSVPYLDNDPSRPGQRIHPTDHLRFVYETFSQAKPIAIGEWAASHESSSKGGSMITFAQTKLAQLYSALPTRYPRVKMVNWYDCNNLVQARSERQLNNFSLTDSKQLLATYRQSIVDPYFIGSDLKPAVVAYQKATKSIVLGPGDQVRIFLKTYDQSPKVYFKVGSQVLHASQSPLQWYVRKEELPSPSGRLEVLVYDSKGRFLIRTLVDYS